jgi:hypothetical protein
MKQVVISVTQESQPVTVAVHGEVDEQGAAGILHSEILPAVNGNTSTVLGIQEGQTLVIS